MSQSQALYLLKQCEHPAQALPCPLLVRVEYQDKDGTKFEILPCDRGVLMAWMGY